MKTTRVALNTSTKTLLLPERERHLRGGFTITCEGPGYCRWGGEEITGSIGDALNIGEIVSVTNEDHASPARGPVYAIGIGGNCVLVITEFY